jgi:glycosyltransferase involved in cell wall biosynthesis
VIAARPAGPPNAPAAPGVAWPLVSIITPTLNGGRFLEEAMRSVAEQDYPHIEHIVVDGGSTDGSVETIEAWATKHPIRWTVGPDSGQADAIQRGVAASTGSIVGWLNADDVLLDRAAIGSIVDVFRQGTRIVTAGGWYIDAEGERISHIPVRPDRIDPETMRCVDWILQPSTFVGRELFAECPLDIGLTYAFDWDWFIRLSRLSSFTPLERDIAGYRVHGQSKTMSGGGRRQHELASVVARYQSRRSLRYVLIRTVAAGHDLADRLPRPVGRGVAWLLLQVARTTQELTGGRGIPS